MTSKRIILLTGVLMISLLVTSYVVVSADVMRPAPTDLLPQIEKIQQDEDYGMGIKQRYHQIHTGEGLNCEDCHTTELSSGEAIFFAQDMSPDTLGPVNRNVCLTCHEGADAQLPLYGIGTP
jgi:hypothetical protein